MNTTYRDYPQWLLGWWVGVVQRHSLPVLAIAVLLTAATLFYSVANFKINVDTSSMISEDLPFRKIENDFSKAFPNLSDTIVVVLDGDTPELALSARKALADRLKKEVKIYKSVYEPGGRFFERNGLLYLSVRELEDLQDTMAHAQPLFAILSRDLSLRGLFFVLGKAVTHAEGSEGLSEKIDPLLDQVRKAFDYASQDRPYHVSWQRLMLDATEATQQQRQFIILQPRLDSTGLSADELPLATVRHAIQELNINKANGVKASITGDIALSNETLTEVKNSVGIATLFSLFVVGIILFIGLGRSLRLVAVCLTTLLIGLIETTGFAIAVIGSLNLISITFAVLFVGLGMDYSIQFCLRYRELAESNREHGDRIITTAKGVGRSLLVSCVTIAIGFYAFVPTAYAGVGELGLISGTGMFISFFANLTVLPALLTLLPLRRKKTSGLSLGTGLLTAPYKYCKSITIFALLAGLSASALLAKVHFDYNPLNLYDQSSEAVSTAKGLFKDPDTAPWTISILAGGPQEAKQLSEKLQGLKEVKRVITLMDFVPDNQAEKLALISDIKLLMPPNLSSVETKRISYAQKLKSMNSFEKALKSSLTDSSESNSGSLQRLEDSIGRFRALLEDPGKGQRSFEILENSLLSGLPVLLSSLETSLQATPFDITRLPQDLKEQYLSPDGRYRIQVFPSEDIVNRDALERFVTAVRSIAPNATDAPVSVYESGRAVISSFRQASLSALVVIILYLLLELRSLSVTALILVPLILAMVMTGAVSVLLNIPLNFANVIVVPLLLGIGVHSGIIFVLRNRTEPPPDGNMLRTSTARAVLLSTTTTMFSTCSLALSSHRGIASMGILLSVCLFFLLLSTLILLPALLELLKGRLRFFREPQNN